jgi:hypothetical protein
MNLLSLIYRRLLSLLCRHDWAFPRWRNGQDIQTCVKCGETRPSAVQFRTKETNKGEPTNATRSRNGI